MIDDELDDPPPRRPRPKGQGTATTRRPTKQAGGPRPGGRDDRGTAARARTAERHRTGSPARTRPAAPGAPRRSERDRSDERAEARRGPDARPGTRRRSDGRAEPGRRSDGRAEPGRRSRSAEALDRRGTSADATRRGTSTRRDARRIDRRAGSGGADAGRRAGEATTAKRSARPAARPAAARPAVAAARLRASVVARVSGLGAPGSGRARTTSARARRSYRKLSGMRLTFVLLFTLAGFTALLVKLAGLQAVSADHYAEQAKQQRLDVETLPAARGAIVDRNGDPLVTTETRKTIYTDPANVEAGKAPEIAAALAPLLGVPAAELQAGLEADSNFSYLARKVDQDTAERVLALGYRGIYTLDEPTRMRPAADLAAGVIGGVDTENVGISGIERTYDAVLSGTPGELVQERSLGGDHTIPSGRKTLSPATPGSTVVLTIDRNLQQVAEKAVADQVATLQAKAGVAVVMDRHTGELMAMASVARDPKTGQTYNDAQNRAITTTYDPGSTMKIVTMSGAIEAGLVSPSSVRHVPAKLEIYEETFSDDSRYQDEDMTVTDILARSSNVGTMGIALDLGTDRLVEGITGFGFGAPTGIGLGQEEGGLVPAPEDEDWSALSVPTLAIGQGLTATPLQVLAAYNTIANDGEYVSPTIVRSVVSPDNHDATRVVADRHQVVSQRTAEQVRGMLSAVVGRGTGTRAAVPGYNVAGKTGTAWKYRAGGGYGSDGDRDYLATFVGFAPAKDPQFSIIVVIDEPRAGAYTGGMAAAPVFSTIARQALVSYDVPPDAPGWAQPADGTNLRARAAVAAPAYDPVVRLAPGVGATAAGATATATATGTAVAPNSGAGAAAAVGRTGAPPGGTTSPSGRT